MFEIVGIVFLCLFGAATGGLGIAYILSRIFKF